MKVLVSTKETQGYRKNDFSWTEEGEPLMAGSMECDSGRVDDNCGCKRALAGFKTLKATTTMKVIESTKYSWPKLTNMMIEHLVRDWKFTQEQAEEIAVTRTQMLLEIVSTFNVGDILERRGNKYAARKI